MWSVKEISAASWLSWVPSPSGMPDIQLIGAVAATSLPEGWKIQISPHTPPHAPGTLSLLPSRPCKDAKHIPSASPLLPVTEGPWAKVWGSPSLSLLIFNILYLFTSDRLRSWCLATTLGVQLWGWCDLWRLHVKWLETVSSICAFYWKPLLYCQ